MKDVTYRIPALEQDSHGGLAAGLLIIQTIHLVGIGQTHPLPRLLRQVELGDLFRGPHTLPPTPHINVLFIVLCEQPDMTFV